MTETRLLFVDDEKDLLAFYRQVFERDFTVTTCGNAAEALELLRQNPADFAVIVSDYSMAGMDGVEFLSLAREVAPHSARILITGYASEETALSAVQRGDIFKLLHKPIRLTEFSAAVRAGVAHHELAAAGRN